MKPLFLPTFLVTALTLLLPGCAKGPSAVTTGGNPASNKQLIVQMQVRGNVDLANDYYFVCFNISVGPSPGTPNARNGFSGPVPVVTDFERGGNGFAGGAFTTFVEIHQGQPQSNVGVYAISPDLHTPSYLGQAINATVSGGTITFRIPFQDIVNASIQSLGTSLDSYQLNQPNAISAIEVNFITTDNISQNPQDTNPRDFDALGNPTNIGTGGLNGFVTIPTGQDTTYQNGLFGTEGPDDVATLGSTSNLNPAQTDFSSAVQILPDQTLPAVANLDIINWSITFSG